MCKNKNFVLLSLNGKTDIVSKGFFSVTGNLDLVHPGPSEITTSTMRGNLSFQNTAIPSKT